MIKNRDQIRAYEAMRKAGFTYARRRTWTIWGSKFDACPVCLQGPFNPCRNMSDVRQNKFPRINNVPHEERVDWHRIVVGLRKRGLIT